VAQLHPERVHVGALPRLLAERLAAGGCEKDLCDLAGVLHDTARGIRIGRTQTVDLETADRLCVALGSHLGLVVPGIASAEGWCPECSDTAILWKSKHFTAARCAWCDTPAVCNAPCGYNLEDECRKTVNVTTGRCRRHAEL
jgi:DNA-binding Xre family transcriptional regulator